ncbi:MAG: hypothetical protein R3344_02445 [Acidobacteriota bacterium]|nr:hypothetical protein [Acidobacteriota bacterium]
MKRNYGRCVLAMSILVAVAAGLPALADTRIEKTLKLGPGGLFVLDSEGGSVTITGSSRSDVSVVITSERDDLESLVAFTFEGGSETARVTMERIKKTNWGRGLSLAYEIEVPRDTRLDLRTSGGSVTARGTRGEAKLRTSGGSIRVNDLDGPVNAGTSGGSITIDSIGGDAKISTSGGNIRGAHVDGAVTAGTSGGSISLSDVKGDLSAETSGGSISIAEAGGVVDAQTSGGSVTVEFAQGNQRGGSLKTSGGGIRVTLDGAANLDLDAHCSGGSVKTDLPVTVVGDLSKNTLKGALGAGGSTLKMRTSGGSIRIESM